MKMINETSITLLKFLLNKSAAIVLLLGQQEQDQCCKVAAHAMVTR